MRPCRPHRRRSPQQKGPPVSVGAHPARPAGVPRGQVDGISPVLHDDGSAEPTARVTLSPGEAGNTYLSAQRGLVEGALQGSEAHAAVPARPRRDGDEKTGPAPPTPCCGHTAARAAPGQPRVGKLGDCAPPRSRRSRRSSPPHFAKSSKNNKPRYFPAECTSVARRVPTACAHRLANSDVPCSRDRSICSPARTPRSTKKKGSSLLSR